jgi:uncharacterized delta-60 repeat protein
VTVVHWGPAAVKKPRRNADHVNVARSKHARGRGRWRVGAAVLAGVILAAAPMGVMGAASTTVVSVDVPSATSINTTGCATGAAGVTQFGLVAPGSSTVTSSNCIVRFGSSNDSASLRVTQQDRVGGAMWQYTRGELDPTFVGPTGTGDGRLLLPIGASFDFATSSVVQPDGRMVLTGQCYNGSNDDFCAARLNLDGSWDAGFAGPSGTGGGRFLLPIGSSTDNQNASVLQADGRVVLAGGCNNGANNDFCVARLNVNGSWDANFVGPSGTSNGRFLLPIGTGHDEVLSSVLQADGKLVLAGVCHNGSNDDFCVARLNPDGSWDTSFIGPLGTGSGRFLLPIGTGHDVARSIVAQADGKLVIAGQCRNGTTDDFCVARLNVNGSWDATFVGPLGTGSGRFMLPIGAGHDIAMSVNVQADGKLVIAGYCHNGADDDFCAARLNASGSWDASFVGPSGTANGRFLLPIGGGADRALDAVLQADGRLVMVGECHNGTNLDVCVARLNADGNWDWSFVGPSGTGNGRFLVPIGTGIDKALSVLQADGKLLLTGWCNGSINFDFCTARLDQGGSLVDYANASSDWSVGASMFGACLESVAAGATAAWSLNAGCAQTNGTSWNAVQTAPSVIARTSVAGTLNAEARLRFGMRTAALQPPGNYVAPVTFDVVAPAV